MSKDTNLTQQPGVVIYWAHKLQRLVNPNLLPIAGAQSGSRGAKADNSQEAGAAALATGAVAPPPPKC